MLGDATPAKVADKFTTAEGHTAELQGEVVIIKRQMAQITMTTKELERRTKDIEGRLRCINIRVQEFHKRAEGSMTEKFLYRAKTTRPSDCFAVERAHRALGPLPPPGAPRD
ncbi:hypothetical protein NDU88_010919 [Pleurodeles waltl]|uniref:Uncharacterized protein n=1 Tax=Pleurodeles waltl TaxID=8319 RepID=A0AAV7PW91_PLEWA|nr:hypothetical protein NDU88_010919 [Pleurodeles waltl]